MAKRLSALRSVVADEVGAIVEPVAERVRSDGTVGRSVISGSNADDKVPRWVASGVKAIVTPVARTAASAAAGAAARAVLAEKAVPAAAGHLRHVLGREETRPAGTRWRWPKTAAGTRPAKGAKVRKAAKGRRKAAKGGRKAIKARRKAIKVAKAIKAPKGAKAAGRLPGWLASPARTLSRDVAVAEGAIGIDRLVRDIRTGRFEQMMAGLTAAGAAVTAVEIFSEHDGASFGNKMMWWPIVIVPVAVPVGIASVFSKRLAKTALPVSSALILANGLQGSYLHWRGIVQKPGGLKNLRYNVEMGPPLFAPLLASLVGGMGVLAAILRREGE